MTLHSFFQLPLGLHLPDTSREVNNQRRFSRDKIQLLRTLDLLVIDQISMVRADLLDAVDDVLLRKSGPLGPAHCNGFNRNPIRTAEFQQFRWVPKSDSGPGVQILSPRFFFTISFPLIPRFHRIMSRPLHIGGCVCASVFGCSSY